MEIDARKDIHMNLMRIAIVGAACRLPGGCDDLDALWDALAGGRDCVEDLSSDRWCRERFYHPDKRVPGRMYVRRAGLVRSLLDFDPALFGISNAETPYLDPQQRLALELAWEALEDAGIPASRLADGMAAVFMGASSMDYAVRFARDLNVTNSRSMQGNSLSIIANRISYFLRLHGPSMTLDTACSSSLHALHQACRLLSEDETVPLAFAGGVNILLAPDTFVGFSKAEMLSPDGRCKAFDASADGYVRSEGGGMLVLKRLADAEAAGDRIHAVILASAANNDGRTSGIAMPSRTAQETLLRDVYERSGLDPARLAYIEAHGTGTAVGDAVEAEAIGLALGQRRKVPLPIGSVKTNLGHLEPASGMAGVLKSILILRHRLIPRNIHFTTPNPNIDFAGLNVAVADRDISFHADSEQLCHVGVNNFGFGGSNAHVILESPPHRTDTTVRVAAAPSQPLVISAASAESLRLQAGNYARIFEKADAPDCRTVAANVRRQREPLSYRLAVEAADREQLARLLNAVHEDKLDADPDRMRAAVDESVLFDKQAGSNIRAAFVFSGNGSQWAGMGKALWESFPAFARAVDEVDALFRAHGNTAVMDELKCRPEQSRLADTRVAQPLLFAVQVGLVEALRQYGIVPDAVFGHSVGEAAAAWCAGALRLEDAVAFIHFRGLCQAGTRGKGGMTAVNISPEAADALAKASKGKLEVAGYNSAASTTLTGDVSALERVESDLAERGVFSSRLGLDYPFHSRRLDSSRKTLMKGLQSVQPRTGNIPFISTVTGAVEEGARIDPEYLWRNVRNPVQFLSATETALDLGVRLFLEIGPHPVLRYYLNDTIKRRGISAAALPTLGRTSDDAGDFRQACLRAWSRGWPTRDDTVDSEPAPRLDLPRYAWARLPVSLPRTEECLEAVEAPAEHPLLGWRVRDLTVWENVIDTVLFPDFADHAILETPFLPATAYIEIALAAARACIGENIELRNLSFERGMPLPAGVRRKIRVGYDSGSGELIVSGRIHGSGGAWTRHMRCRIGEGGGEAPDPLPHRCDPSAFGEMVSASRLYRLPPQFGFSFGPAFSSVDVMWRQGDRALSRLRDKTGRIENVWRDAVLCPTLLDSALHAGYVFLHENPDTRGKQFLPVGIDRAVLHRPGIPAWSLFTLHRRNGQITDSDVIVYDEAGSPLALLEKLRWRLTGDSFSGKSIGPLLSQRMLPRPLDGLDIQPANMEHLKQVCENARATATAEEFGRFVRLAQPALIAAAAEALAPALTRLPTSLDAIMTRLNVTPDMRPYLVFLLNSLQGVGLAEEREGGWRLGAGAPAPVFAEAWRLLLEAFPHRADWLALLLEVTGDGTRMREHLRGQTATSRDSLSTWYHETIMRIGGLDSVFQKLASTLAEPERDRGVFRFFQACAGHGRLLEILQPVLAGMDYEYAMAADAESSRDVLRSRWRAFGRAKVVDTIKPPEKAAGKPGSDERAHAAFIVNALQTPRETETTLALCRERLIENGTLVFVRQYCSPMADFLFGIRPEWWEEQYLSPERDACLQLLHRAGFDNIEILLDGPDALVLAARSQAEMINRETESTAGDSGEWLLLADAVPSTAAKKMLDFLRDNLTARGGRVRAAGVHAGSGKAKADALHADSVDNWKELWAGQSRDGPVRCLSLLGFDSDPSVSNELFRARVLPQIKSLVLAARGWTEAGGPSASLTILSAGGQDAAGLPPVPSQGAVWGLGRVLMNETPRLNVRLIDVHLPERTESENGTPPHLAALLRDILEPDAETEVVLAEGRRFCPRVEAVDMDSAARVKNSSENLAVRLSPSPSGGVEKARWIGLSLPAPGPGQVLVRPFAVGLNFRDVMCAMGVLPTEAFTSGAFGPALGMEFCGVVESIGNGVRDFVPGDEVAGIGPAALSSLVLADARFLLPRPEGLSHGACASLPIALTTAWHALVSVGRLRKGERVLVHAATGGVGLMAVQIARLMGVEVFATAGSEVKRAYLRLLGVEHVFDSRSLEFAGAVRRASGGDGVDAVLNSLAGDAMRQSIDILRPYGRFLELGKTDLYGDATIGLRALRRNVSYHAVDLDAYAKDRPEEMASLLREVWPLVRDGRLRPPPYKEFSASLAGEALRDMQRARHIGKLVCSTGDCPPPWNVQPKAAADAGAACTYLVTGGTSGFGLASALWLADRGVRHFLLVSRSGKAEGADAAVIDELRQLGAEVRLAAIDVADAETCSARFDAALSGMPPLRGVVHAAGAVEDAPVSAMTPEQVERVLLPKTLGAWNLHTYSLRHDVGEFLLFSSVAAFLGNRGQANYAAGNASLDTLAAHRRAQGLPALSVAWGPVGDTGMLTRNPAAQAVLRRQLGLSFLHSAAALGLLTEALSQPLSPAAIFLADGGRLLRLPAARTPRFSEFAHLLDGSALDGESFLEEIREKPEEEAKANLERFISERVAAALRLGREHVNVNAALDSFGVDSLMAVEIGLGLESAMGDNAPHVTVIANQSIRDLAAQIYDGLLLGAGDSAVPAPSVDDGKRSDNA